MNSPQTSLRNSYPTVPDTGQSRKRSGGWRRLQDLLDPYVPHSARCQPLEVAGGVRETVDMIDPQAVDVAVGDQRQQQTVGRLEDVGVLLPQAGQLIDVEEPAVAAGDGVDVEEFLTTLGVGPVGIALVRGHVIGHDVEDDSEPSIARCLRQTPELSAAAEVIRQARRVDHVVAVPRAGTGLERR